MGEIAIILASAIEPIPITAVFGIQQCTPPFNMDVESYFWKKQKDEEVFLANYDEWLKGEL